MYVVFCVILKLHNCEMTLHNSHLSRRMLCLTIFWLRIILSVVCYLYANTEGLFISDLYIVRFLIIQSSTIDYFGTYDFLYVNSIISASIKTVLYIVVMLLHISKNFMHRSNRVIK